MQYLSEDQVTQMMGIGYHGEVRQGQDGNLYQFVQGVDGLGNPIGGWWSKLRRGLRAGLRLAQRGASFIPGPYGAAIATGLKIATPLLQKAGVAGYEGIGALYEAPDGSLYQVQGLAADEELQGIGEDAMTQMMGIGYLGEVRQGPDGNLYQYVQGVDGLGNPIGGFWRRFKRLARRVARKALPYVQQFAPLIPGVGPAVSVLTSAIPAAPAMMPTSPAEAPAAMPTEAMAPAETATAGWGLGALYQAPDGTLYQQVQGLAEDEELRGLAEDEELRGLDEDEELRGIDEDEELRGLSEEELRGVAEDQDMQGIDGYVRQDGVSGLEAFVPQEPPQTRWHVTPAQAPEVWKSLW